MAVVVHVCCRVVSVVISIVSLIYVVFFMDNLSCFVNMNASGNNCFPFMVESISLRLATEFTTGISQLFLTTIVWGFHDNANNVQFVGIIGISALQRLCR